jgi:Tfp pilus assembly protein PilN
MQNLYGIVHTDDGRYIMASVRYDESNVWKLAGLKQWESHNVLKRIFLLHRGIYFGIKSWQKPQESDFSDDNLISAIYDKPDVLASGNKGNLDIVTNSADLNAHKEALCANLLGVISEDAFLATIPLCMHGKTGDSFVTVYGNGQYYIIGITVNEKLLASFRMALGAHEKLSGHLGRIERYWNVKFPDVEFPDRIIAMGDPDHTPDTAFDKPAYRVESIPQDEHPLKAMGCALAQEKKVLPLFTKETQESFFRKKRTLIYSLSAGFLLLGLLSFTVLSGLNIWYNNKKTAYENEYQKVIGNNQEIKKLLKRSNELAETIMRLENTLSRQTTWGKFFHAIGNERPEDLFFERLGTEPVKDKEQAVRVALTGWSSKEGNITDFIAKLQGMPYITEVILSSIERNKKKRSIFGFKILCTLLLNE